MKEDPAVRSTNFESNIVPFSTESGGDPLRLRRFHFFVYVCMHVCTCVFMYVCIIQSLLHVIRVLTSCVCLWYVCVFGHVYRCTVIYDST
jgi:hypothetical protein